MTFACAPLTIDQASRLLETTSIARDGQFDFSYDGLPVVARRSTAEGFFISTASDRGNSEGACSQRHSPSVVTVANSTVFS